MEVSLQKQHNHFHYFIFLPRTIFLHPYLLTFGTLMEEQPDNHCSGCRHGTEVATVMLVVLNNYLSTYSAIVSPVLYFALFSSPSEKKWRHSEKYRQ